MKYYSLIAFKPEKKFNDRGDDIVLPAKLSRSDNLTKEEIIDLIKSLGTKEPLIEYAFGIEPDCVYEQFHIFSYNKMSDSNEYLEENDDIQEIRKISSSLINEIEYEKEQEEIKRYEKLRKELEQKRLEYEKLKLEFEGKK